MADKHGKLYVVFTSEGIPAEVVGACTATQDNIIGMRPCPALVAKYPDGKETVFYIFSDIGSVVKGEHYEFFTEEEIREGAVIKYFSKVLMGKVKGKDEDDRENAVVVLGKIGATAVTLVLAAALFDDPYHMVRWRAAITLGKIGDAKAIPALTAAAQYDPDEYVRKEASKALKKLKPKER